MTPDLPPRVSGTRASGRRVRADRQRNVELLISAARTLFVTRGTDVPLDEIARRAGVGNATLYRNFPTRGDLLVAVYSEEVEALCGQGDALRGTADPGQALFDWLGLFVTHAATRRPLAMAAIGADSGTRGGELAHDWHAAMGATTAALLAPAQDAGVVRGDVTAADVLALVNAIALAGADPPDAVRLIGLLRGGLETRAARRP